MIIKKEKDDSAKPAIKLNNLFMKKTYIFLYLFLSFFLLGELNISLAQDSLRDIDYAYPEQYEIGGINISGIQFLDANAIRMVSGLEVGQKLKIPGDEISKAIDNLWKQGLFSNIKISIEKIVDKSVFLNISLIERARLSHIEYLGIKKGAIDDLKEKISLSKGDVVTENDILRMTNNIKKHYIDKGFLNAEVELYLKKDTSSSNNVVLFIKINKHKKVKIENIFFQGTHQLTDVKLKGSMKNTKERFSFDPLSSMGSYLIKLPVILYKNPSLTGLFNGSKEHFKDRVKLNLFKASKFIEEDYKKDKLKIIETYNELGYRDAQIISDTISKNDSKTININLQINEGHKFYLRNLTWVGNTKYTSQELNAILKLKKGDVYNQKILEQNLFMNMESGDVSSLYLDNGYLFFNVTPVEVWVANDSIDLEIRIYEGAQAEVNRIIVKGNTKTNDHVILREIRSRPGSLFNRSDIIRTQRELAQLRYFDQEKLSVNPKPNPADGTVDIDYGVEEVSSDQLEVSGGWGAGRIIGTLGFSFNNFSTRNIFKREAWKPLPSGDGQKLTIRAQSNGTYYQGYNASFTEPWLGSKSPTALTVSVFRSVQNYGGKISINGVSVGLGKKLKWPDDFFNLYQSVNFQNYNLTNYSLTPSFQNGHSNNINYSIIISRNSSGDNFYYPTHGSDLSLMIQATPPYSLFSNKDYTDESGQQKYKWMEFHKWKFKSAYYTSFILPKMVLSARTAFGFVGMYNKNLGLAPFGRFYLGGDGLTGYALDDREVIALRGYENQSLTPSNNQFRGGTIYNKYTLELRYPLSLNPMSTIYVLGFLEAGNAWLDFKTYNPYDVKRSAGVGFRIFLPMFGLLGVDWGYGFDPMPGKQGRSGPQFHFSIGQSME